MATFPEDMPEELKRRLHWLCSPPAKARLPAISPELHALARRAVARKNEPVDIDEWAGRIADAVAGATD